MRNVQKLEVITKVTMWLINMRCHVPANTTVSSFAEPHAKRVAPCARTKVRTTRKRRSGNNDSNSPFLYNNDLLLPYQPNGIMEPEIGCLSERMDERSAEAHHGVCANAIGRATSRGFSARWLGNLRTASPASRPPPTKPATRRIFIYSANHREHGRFYTSF